MKLQIEVNNFESTPEVKKYLRKKIGNLVRFLPKLEKEFDLVIRAVLNKSTRHKKGEVFECRLGLALPGDYLEVAETGETPETAIDKVEAGLNRKIRRYKSKWRDRTRRALRKVKEMLELS